MNRYIVMYSTQAEHKPYIWNGIDLYFYRHKLTKQLVKIVVLR